MEATIYNAFSVMLFKRLQNPPFSPVHIRKGAINNAPLLKPFTQVSVFFNVFGRFSVYVRRKRCQKECIFIRKRMCPVFDRFLLFCFQGKFYRRLLFAVLYLLGFSLAIYLRPRHLDPKRIETRDDKVRDFYVICL